MKTQLTEKQIQWLWENIETGYAGHVMEGNRFWKCKGSRTWH